MKAKPLSKSQILEAMRHTRSNLAAARYLGVSYQHYKPYAKMFIDEETRISLFDQHLNRAGKGIPKHLKGKEYPALKEIFEGTLNPCHFSPEKIKSQLIYENYLAEECSTCKFNERRILDYKIPLLLAFKDGNKNNWKLENLELKCYNCYFLYIGNVFTETEINAIQDIPRDTFKLERTEFDLDDEQIENMKALGIM